MSADIGLSGTATANPCAVCAETIPTGRPGVVVGRAAGGFILLCFRCVDVMADLVAEERRQAEVNRRARPLRGRP